MAATSVKSIDSPGPDGQFIEVAGKTYVIGSTDSGAGWTQICQTSGPMKTTRLLLDLNRSGENVTSVDDLVGTPDGRVHLA